MRSIPQRRQPPREPRQLQYSQPKPFRELLRELQRLQYSHQSRLKDQIQVQISHNSRMLRYGPKILSKMLAKTSKISAKMLVPEYPTLHHRSSAMKPKQDLYLTKKACEVKGQVEGQVDGVKPGKGEKKGERATTTLSRPLTTPLTGPWLHASSSSGRCQIVYKAYTDSNGSPKAYEDLLVRHGLDPKQATTTPSTPSSTPLSTPSTTPSSTPNTSEESKSSVNQVVLPNG